MRFGTRPLAVWLVALGGTTSTFACATSNDAAGDVDADVREIPRSDAGGADGSGDGCVDGGQCTRDIDCTKMDFCSTPLPVSRVIGLNAVWGSGPNDVWVVGTRGTILHSDGSGFVPLAAGSTDAADLYVAVWGSGPNDVWVLGASFPLHSTGYRDGTAAFEARKGSSWDPAAARSGRIWAGQSAEAGVWIAGEPSMRFGRASSFWSLDFDVNGDPTWKGLGACAEGDPCTPAIRCLWAVDPTTLFAVGHSGSAFVLDTASGRWRERDSAASEDLEGIWGSSSDDVWVVGKHGTIRHASRGAARWTETLSPTTRDLHAVWGSGPRDVWAVGDFGTIVHYDGTSWSLSELALPNGDTPTDLFGVWGSGPEDVWIVGEGLLLHRSASNRRLP